MTAELAETVALDAVQPSDAFLAALEPFEDVVLVSHVNPDPDALASMLGIEALLYARRPGRPVVLTIDGILARAENQAMVDTLAIPLVPIHHVVIRPTSAVVMVDTQPRPCKPGIAAPPPPTVVLDHHETPGALEGVALRDIRPDVGATCTIVAGYLREQGVEVDCRLATALLYGIESETLGFPREAGPSDDESLVWLFPRADKDQLARIRNPRLSQGYFAVYQSALANAFLYRDVVLSWCGVVPQPDIVAELADFFIRFDEVGWALSAGLYDDQLKFSLRSDHIGGGCGDVLRQVVDGLGTAGGHDRRAGGMIPLDGRPSEAVDDLLTLIRGRILALLRRPETQGRRLLHASPVIEVP